MDRARPAAEGADIAALRASLPSGGAAAHFALASALVQHGEMEQAFDHHQRAAADGHAAAQIESARMLLHGMGCDPDPAAAVGWLERAERAGHPVAAYLLALVAAGDTVLPRDGRMNQRVLQAMGAEFPPALRAAAIHFGRKPGRDDQALCMQLLERGAARGDAVAALLLAERLLRGEGCRADAQAAASLQARLRAAGVPALPAIVAAPCGQADAPPRTLQLELATQVPEVGWLSQAPRVGVVDGLLSADECRLLVACAQPMLRASQTVDPQTGAAIALPIRTSSDAAFDPIVEDLALRLVQARMAAAAGLGLVQAEHLTVLRYAPGQEYRPHRDYLPEGRIADDHPAAGNRLRTVCTYLNAVPSGGATVFPVAAVEVAPEPGRAVVFDNLRPDGAPDPDSLHAGQPVLSGEKWLATLWIRQRPYRAF